MSPSSWTAAALSVGAFFANLPTGDGHAYMMIPISRQLWGTEAFQNPGDGGEINYCPHCFQSGGPANIRARGGDKPWPHFNGERAANNNYIESDEVSKRHGICGDPGQTEAEGSNMYGRDNSNYPVMETYAEGGILEVKIVVSTYHWGHVEMFLCNADDLPDGPDSTVTQSCFNKYPLNRAEDDEFNGPIDPDYKGRFILDPPCRAAETDQELLPGAYPGDVATARYQLPEGVTCSRCVVQMVYYTGNSCKHQGYAEFNPPSWPSECAPEKAYWINPDNLIFCGEDDRYPEEFWNCADVEITSDGGPGPTPSAPAPREEPEPVTPTPTYAPDPEEDEYDAPTPAPASVYDYEEPTPAPVYDYEEPTPAPVYDYEEPTPAPVYDYEEPTPAPVYEPEPATPMDEPSTPIVATFAPSVAAPVSPDGDCTDPVAAFNQCGGGDDYEGSTCCRAGYECQEMSDCYSECRPSAECSEGWGQCGGIGWEGPACCFEGAKCLERNEWYSQCVPDEYLPNGYS